MPLLRKMLDGPLAWWFYPSCVAAAILGNIVELGPRPATLRGGLLVGLVVLIVLCGARRWLVGHWR